MALVLNTTKAAQALTMSLKKRDIITPPTIDVRFIYDCSGSFRKCHSSGATNDFMARILPWALVFDPDKKFELYTHADGVESAHYVGDVNEDNYQGFMKKNVIDKVPGYGQGTDFSHVLKLISSKKEEVQKGLFGKIKSLFGSSKPVEQPKQAPSIVFFVTDGENQDVSAAYEQLRNMGQENTFIFFVGIETSNTKTDFSQIKKYADAFSFVDQYVIEDINAFNNLDNDALNEKFLTPKFFSWLKNL